MNINSKGEDILKKLARDERMINYNNLFFRSGSPAIENYVFLKKFGILYDFLIDFLNERIDIIKASKEQSEMTKKINKLRNFVLSEEERINNEKSRGAVKKSKTKAQRRENISLQRSVINNVIKLHDKLNIIIDAFINKNILPGDLEEECI